MRYGTWLYPWDLVDIGPDRLGDELAAAGFADLCVATSYHSVRALSPANPRRRFYDATQAAIYFEPSEAMWDAVECGPVVSPLLANGVDPLRVAGELCKRHRLRLVGWTVCLHNSALPQRYPQLAMSDVWGGRCEVAACVANPVSRRFACALVADVAARVDVVQLEAAHWVVPHAAHPKTDVARPELLRQLMAYCICEHCARRVVAEHGDPDRLRADLGAVADAIVEEEPYDIAPADVESYLAGKVRDYAAFRSARRNAVTSLVADLVAAAGGKPVELVVYGDRTVAGVDLAAVERLGVDVRVLAYGDAESIRASLTHLRAASDAPARFGVGLSALRADAADAHALRAAHDAAVECGATSVTYYNYGMLNARRRGWLREVVRAGR